MSNIFQDAGATTPENNNTPAGVTPGSTEQLTTLLAGITNERGEQKYKTTEEALKALQHSQNFIPDLKNQLSSKDQELQALKAQAAELEALKDTVSKLTQKLTETPSNPQGNQISEEAIAELVGRQLTARQVAEKASQNQASVAQALQAQYGEKASEMFYSKAKELGMSQDQINSLAASSPQAVLTMFGVTGGAAHKRAINLPLGTLNTAQLSNSPGKSLIGREDTPLTLGARSSDVLKLVKKSRDMVDELHQNGMTVQDLTNPSTFFKYFDN